MIERLLLLLPLFVLSLTASAQSYPKGYFRMPMDIDPSLSATFGEVRGNHYHSGLDIRTGGEIGQPVYAAADGYVSRVNISPWGGGKVLYIDHPNGYRTVYMHLNEFCGDIAEWVDRYQYSHQCYAFDTNVPAGLLRVRKGDQIAYSGNTGSSGGPHLHFEIRHAHNDQTINAQLFGLSIPDGVAPTIKGIRIYPATSAATINGKNEPLELMVPARPARKGQKARAATMLSPTVDGPFYLGIYTTDHSETYNGNNGVYLIELRIDDRLVYKFESVTFRFEDTRSVNGIMDYAYYAKTRRPYVLTRILPFAPATLSHPQQGDGTFYLAPGQHKLRYDVYDFNGNRASKTFAVSIPTSQQRDTRPMRPQRQHGPQHLSSTLYQVELPSEALYTSDSLTCTMADNRLTVVPEHEPSNPTPPHVSYTLRLNTVMASALRYRNSHQLLVVRYVGGKRFPIASQTAGGWVEAHPRDFGTFGLAVDTIAPTIRPPRSLLARPGAYMVFKINDDFAGIDRYSCTFNQRWILAEYDGKTSSLIIRIPSESYDGIHPQLLPSGNTVRITVTDLCGNTTEREFALQR